ncbi:50S ribosomal protein L1 [Clonorchis sinensis]|uniref:50S ribosomal protein L1 n=2 Tax=Clonorchis sinensis TaxID=79923 RepID=A0A8T1MJS8_CLOSI|nr:50S ribosomal protein L1 [Clonorchis sinensis]GAA36525.2 50S ribosomal protein L1 [Clonorchis sinensis]
MSLHAACRIPFLHPTAYRSLTTSSRCLKGNTRKPRLTASGMGVMSEKSKEKRDSARQLLATTNRKKWEDTNRKLAALTGKLPTTNVYLSANFEQRHFLLAEAAEFLREAAQPEMFDCLQNPLRAKFTLNMRTKKKTKFLQKFEGHVVLPNSLDFLPKSRVIALCKDADDAALAVEAGAVHAGGTELFTRLENGSVHWEEYDTVVAHTDWEPTLKKLRHVLKERLPTMRNGRIGSDVLTLVTTHSIGISMESTALEGVPEIAFLDVIIGQLAWDATRLETNMQAYFDAVQSNKSSRVPGNAVLSVELYCPPTGERFPIDLAPYLPVSAEISTADDDNLEEETVLTQNDEFSQALTA